MWVLGIKSWSYVRAISTLNAEMSQLPILVLYESRSHYIAQGSFELIILLPLPPNKGMGYLVFFYAGNSQAPSSYKTTI